MWPQKKTLPTEDFGQVKIFPCPIHTKPFTQNRRYHLLKLWRMKQSYIKYLVSRLSCSAPYSTPTSLHISGSVFQLGSQLAHDTSGPVDWPCAPEPAHASARQFQSLLRGNQSSFLEGLLVSRKCRWSPLWLSAKWKKQNKKVFLHLNLT